MYRNTFIDRIAFFDRARSALSVHERAPLRRDGAPDVWRQGRRRYRLLTGEVGTGKTTLCRSLIELLPNGVDMAFVLDPRMNAVECCKPLRGIPHRSSARRARHPDLCRRAQCRLLANHALGHRAILIVDEAQNLSAEVLEQLRLLTNLETNTRKLLQIFLIGQPELQTMLSQPEMRRYRSGGRTLHTDPPRRR